MQAAAKWCVLAVGVAAAAFTDIETAWVVVGTLWALVVIALFGALREHEGSLAALSPADRAQHQEDMGI